MVIIALPLVYNQGPHFSQLKPPPQIYDPSVPTQNTRLYLSASLMAHWLCCWIHWQMLIGRWKNAAIDVVVVAAVVAA